MAINKPLFGIFWMVFRVLNEILLDTRRWGDFDVYGHVLPRLSFITIHRIEFESI
jgi:hypothetical protein